MERRTWLVYHPECPYFFDAESAAVSAYSSYSRMGGRFIGLTRRLGLSIPEKYVGRWLTSIGPRDNIVFLDSAYDSRLSGLVKERMPEARQSILFWNPVGERERKVIAAWDRSEPLFSYSCDDCTRYGLHPVRYFYSKAYAETFSIQENLGAVFIGKSKGRDQTLGTIAQVLRLCEVDTKIQILGKPVGCNRVSGIEYVDNYLPYDDVADIAASSRILIDVSQRNVSALNLRVMEAIFFGKKLLTTNKNIKEYDFYNSNNIMYFDDRQSVSSLTSDVEDFLSRPVVPVANDIRSLYDMRTALDEMGACIQSAC